MKLTRFLVSWASTVTVIAVCVWLCYEFRQSESSTETMRNAGAPSRAFLENPRLQESMGPSLQDAMLSVGGPDYDLSQGMEVE